MLLTNDISFLQVETVQVIKCILGLYNKMHVAIKPVSTIPFQKMDPPKTTYEQNSRTYIHHIVEHNESSPLRLSFVS